MTLSVAIQHKFERFKLNLSFETCNGITALFGRSGAGKTTVINAVAGLLSPDAGTITLDGEILHDRAKGINKPAAARRLG